MLLIGLVGVVLGYRFDHMPGKPRGHKAEAEVKVTRGSLPGPPP